MARYIDLEELERRIKKHVKPEIPEEKAFVEWCKDECIRQAYAMPTANVVPRAEVAILTAQNMALENAKYELQHELNKYKCVENIIKDNMGKLISAAINGAKQEVAREIFEEIEKFVAVRVKIDGVIRYDIRDKFIELKKKYTEEKG